MKASITPRSQFRSSEVRLKGETLEVRPTTHRRLKMQDPTALPRIISPCLLMAATMDVASSGSDVPKATMVKAMVASGTLK